MQFTDKAREFILAQLEPIVQELSELNARTTELEAQKLRLEEALKPLEAQKKKPKASDHQKQLSAKKQRLPSVKKEDVRPVCLDFVKDNPNIERSVLEGLVEEKLVNEKGFGRNGLAMQIQKCLDSELFATSDTGRVSLATVGSVVVAKRASDAS